MNWDQMEGMWKQMKGDIRRRWGKLTDDDMETIGGQKDKLVGVLQERYGIKKEEAQRQADEWRAHLRDEEYRAPGESLPKAG